MNRISGAAIKSAVSTSAAMQIAAAGVRCLTSTRWSGKTAYAAWSETGSYDSTAVINYPLLSDEAQLTRVEADLIAAYTLHETGHVIYTARVGLHGDLHSIWNGIEDGWMENRVISGRAKGAKQLFTRLLNKLTHDLPPTFNPCKWEDAAFALALLSRQALGNGNAFSGSLLDRIPEPKRGLYEAVMKGVLASSNSFDNAVLAQTFAEEFKKLDADKARQQAQQPAPPPAPPADDYWKDDGEEETPAQDDELDDPDVIVDPPVSEEPPPSGIGNDGPEDDLDDEPGDDLDDLDDLDDEPGDDSESGESDDDLDGESGESNEPDESNESGESNEPDESNESGELGESDDEIDGPGAGQSTKSFQDDESSDGDVKSPEPSIDDIVNRAHKRTVQRGDSLPAYTPAPRAKRSASRPLPNSVEFGPTPGSLKTQLSRLLMSVDRIGWDNGATSGRFDVRRTSRMMAGSERVFKKRWETEAISSRVTILVDMSSSMEVQDSASGQYPIALCSDIAYALAEVCERVGCAVEVVGFKSHSQYGSYVHDLSGVRQKSASFDKCPAQLVEYKRFDQRVRDAKSGLYSIRLDATGSTPDAHALRTCVEEMGVTTEHRRLVLVLTDGFGTPDKVRQVCDAAPKRGVTVIGVGILTDPAAMAEAYPVSACASSMHELSTVAIRSLIKQL
jgi:hypothetical protein